MYGNSGLYCYHYFYNNSGSTYHLLKQFVQYNYVLNVQSNTSPRTVWPLVAFMSDSIVMWKKLHPSGRFVTHCKT